MSVESKIKELLGRVNAKANLDEAEQMGAGAVKKDTSISPANSGDASSPMQGNSEKASYEERDEKEENQGAKAAKSVSKAPVPQGSGAGSTPNFDTVKDLASVVNMSASTGNKHVNEEEETEEEVVAEDQTEETPEVAAIDLSPIFGADLSEEFKQKATSIFEAAVIARVNAEMEKVSSALEEQYAEEFVELKEGMVEKIDSYLNYVVEQWMDENKLAIENGLRTEIAEDFISGLKSLFKEHYVEVPDEKYDVIGELESKKDELETKLNESMNINIELAAEINELKRMSILEAMSKDLADTEAVKLAKLVEGVSFDSEDLYAEKVSVIKENYFPKHKPETVAQTTQTLVEDMSTPVENVDASSTVAVYAKALSRTIKRA